MDNILQKASHIYTLTSEKERELLSRLAEEVPENGSIVEVGCLYGGITAILALSSSAAVTTIDNFSWNPEGYPKTSKALLEANMLEIGVHNVTVIEDDSRVVGKKWRGAIDLLWIDGGHSFNYVYSDLFYLGRHARVIALHDYDNPAWPSVRQAVEVFTVKYPNFVIDKVVDMVIVLRRQDGSISK